MNPRHRAALEAAREQAAKAAQQPVDRRAWAREVVAACERGERPPRLRVREAHVALGLAVPRWAR